MEHLVVRIVSREAAGALRRGGSSATGLVRASPHAEAGAAYAGRCDELVLLDPRLDDPDFEAAGVDPHADVVYIEPGDSTGQAGRILADYPSIGVVHVLAAGRGDRGRRFLSPDGRNFPRDPDLAAANLVAEVQRTLMRRGEVVIERRTGLEERSVWLVTPIESR